MSEAVVNGFRAAPVLGLAGGRVFGLSAVCLRRARRRRCCLAASAPLWNAVTSRAALETNAWSDDTRSWIVLQNSCPIV